MMIVHVHVQTKNIGVEIECDCLCNPPGLHFYRCRCLCQLHKALLDMKRYSSLVIFTGLDLHIKDHKTLLLVFLADSLMPGPLSLVGRKDQILNTGNTRKNACTSPRFTGSPPSLKGRGMRRGTTLSKPSALKKLYKNLQVKFQ